MKPVWIGRDGDRWSKARMKRYELYLKRQNGFDCEVVPFMAYQPEGKPVIKCETDVAGYMNESGLYPQAKDKK